MKRVSCEFDIELHVKACSVPTQDCAKCLFASECQTRRWLLHAKTGYGCKICRKGRANSQWAACTIKGALCLKKQNLDRHANSKVHIHCQTKALVLSHVVPDAAMYKRLVVQLKLGIYSARALAKALGISKQKAVRLKWTLSEGARWKNRNYLRSPGLILSLAQDAKSPYLGVVFHGCNDALERRSHLLAMIDSRFWKDNFAEHVKEQTMLAVARACTPFYQPPEDLPSGELDEDLFKKVLHAIEIFAADAEGTEQLVGRMFRGRQLQELVLDSHRFPNLLVVSRDPGHASRRIGQRGFRADSYLWSIHLNLLGKRCFIQRIQWSKPLQAVFQEHVCKSRKIELNAKRIKNLNASKVRWESGNAPYRRKVLFQEALLGSAHTIQNGRHGKDEAIAATTFIQNEDEERWLQSAMMADACDEQYMVTTGFDGDPTFAISRFNCSITQFIVRHRALFVDGLVLETGLTRMMLQKLRGTRRLMQLADGSSHVLGGRDRVPDSMVLRCQGRMAAYEKLAEDICNAEWPQYEIFRAFCIFNLEGLAFDKIQVSEVSPHIERICHILKEPDHEEVLEEYMYFLVVAAQEYKTCKDDFQAWANAVFRTIQSKRRNFGKRIRQVVKRLGGWTSSSTTLERLFSSQTFVSNPQRSECSEQLVDNDAVLIWMLQRQDDVDEIIKYAQHAWSQFFGSERSSPEMPSVARGRKRDADPKSESSLVKRRRAEVASVLTNPAVARQVVRPEDYWTEQHEKEALFQRQKDDINQLEAFEQGHLMPHEHSENLPERLLNFQMRRAKNNVDRLRGNAKHNLQLAEHVSFLQNGQAVFLTPGVDCHNLQNTCRRRGLRLVDRRSLAGIIVVKDVTRLGIEPSWCLALSGGVVCDPEYISCGGSGKAGLARKCMSAMRVGRDVYMSPGFIGAHASLAGILGNKITAPGSKWRILTRAQCLQKIASMTHAKRNQLLLLVTDDEQTSPLLRNVLFKLTAVDAATLWLEWEPMASCSNLCGR